MPPLDVTEGDGRCRRSGRTVSIRPTLDDPEDDPEAVDIGGDTAAVDALDGEKAAGVSVPVRVLVRPTRPRASDAPAFSRRIGPLELPSTPAHRCHAQTHAASPRRTFGMVPPPAPPPSD